MTAEGSFSGVLDDWVELPGSSIAGEEVCVATAADSFCMSAVSMPASMARVAGDPSHVLTQLKVQQNDMALATTAPGVHSLAVFCPDTF